MQAVDLSSARRIKMSDSAIVIEVASQKLARQFVENSTKPLAAWASKFGREFVELRYPKAKRPYRILASMAEDSVITDTLESLTPAIDSKGLPITTGILRALDTIRANPDEKWILSRLSYDLDSQVQIAMTQSCQSLIVGASTTEALGRKRSEYWDLADLQTFSQLVRQRMGVGQTTEFKFKGYSPITRSNWREFTYRYQIIDDVDGHLWQLGQNLDVKAITAPVSG